MTNKGEILTGKRKLQERVLRALRDALLEAGCSLEDAKRAEDGVFDLELIIKPPSGRFRFLAALKATGQPGRIRDALAAAGRALSGSKKRALLLCPFLSPKGRELCRQYGLGYADAAGNCYISVPGLLVAKSVEENPEAATRPLKSLFSRRASRVLRALLCEPERRWTQLELSQTTGTSLGHVNSVVRRLIDQDYLRKIGNLLYLPDPTRLLKVWQESYSIDQHERIALLTLEPLKEFERRLDEYCARTGARYALTAFAGASYRAPYVRFNRVHTYFSGNIDEAMEALDLKKVTTGANVILLLPADDGVYYRSTRQEQRNIVCDVQLYLDLMSGKERGEEQARYLLQERLPQLFGTEEDIESEANFHRYLAARDRAEGEQRNGQYEQACVAFEQAATLLNGVRDRDVTKERLRLQFLQWLCSLEACVETGKRDYLTLAESIFARPGAVSNAVRRIGWSSGSLKYGLFLYYLLLARFSEGADQRKVNLKRARDYLTVVTSGYTEGSRDYGPRAQKAWAKAREWLGDRDA